MNQEKIWALVEAQVSPEGYAVVQVALSSKKEPHVQVLLENCKTHSLELEECIKLFHRVEACLRENQILKEENILEISSPGIQRPLVKREQFARYIHYQVALKLYRALEGKTYWLGQLTKVSRGGIVLTRGQGAILSIDWASIRDCHLVQDERDS